MYQVLSPENQGIWGCEGITHTGRLSRFVPMVIVSVLTTRGRSV